MLMVFPLFACTHPADRSRRSKGEGKREEKGNKELKAKPRQPCPHGRQAGASSAPPIAPSLHPKPPSIALTGYKEHPGVVVVAAGGCFGCSLPAWPEASGDVERGRSGGGTIGYCALISGDLGLGGGLDCRAQTSAACFCPRWGAGGCPEHRSESSTPPVMGQAGLCPPDGALNLSLP